MLPAEPAELIERIDQLTTQLLSFSSWSAPIARPEDMAKYQAVVPDAPERIFRMAEARTVDASKRIDRLVGAEISQAKSDRSVAMLFLLTFTIASIVFFAIAHR